MRSGIFILRRKNLAAKVTLLYFIVIMFSRIIHSPSGDGTFDVFLGAAIGYFTAQRVLFRHPDDEAVWSVTPIVYDECVGLSFGYRF